MNRTKFLHQIAKNFLKGEQLILNKNQDYSSSEDPFANFRAAEWLGLTIEQGILLRLSDKMMRINNLLSRPQNVNDESIEDTLLDAINYNNILLTYIQSKKYFNKKDKSNNVK